MAGVGGRSLQEKNKGKCAKNINEATSVQYVLGEKGENDGVRPYN